MSDTSPNAIGVLGGSFDPVHLGHLRIAEQVRSVFSLRRLLLVPCAIPPHKPERSLSEDRHRLQMLRLAVEDREGLEVDTIELDRGGVSYTIDTLRAIAQRPPGETPLLVIGMDSLIELPTWHCYPSLLREFDCVAVDRPREDSPETELDPEILARMRTVGAAEGSGAGPWSEAGTPGGRVFRLPLEPIPISSSGVRRCSREGLSLDGLVPSVVARYIQDARLYGGREPS